MASTETFVNSSSTETVNHTYQNAVFHRQGLGFCGFETITSVDDHNRTKVFTYAPYQYGNLVKVVTPESRNTYNYTVSRRTNGTLRIVLGSKIEEDLLKGTSQSTMITNDDYGYPTYVSTYFPDGSAANKTNTYNHNTTVGDGYLLGFLAEQISKRHKGGETYQERMYIPAGSNGYPNVKIHYIGENQTDITVFMYDSCGNTRSKNVTPYSSTISHLTSYNYDSFGRLIKEVNPMGLSNEYVFDVKGRVSSSKDKRNNVTTYAYDSFGRDTLTVYPDGTKKTIKYAWCTDRDGELYSITTSETGQPTETVYYDALNREVRRGTVRFDGSIIYVDKVYNSKGKLEKESLPYKIGSASLWNVYTYDGHDRVTAYTEASGRTTTYTYNGTEVTTVEDGVSITRDYDSHGNLITVEDAAGTVTYNLWADGQPTSIVAPGDVTTTFGYDEYRRHTSINDPSHGLTIYHYDVAGNVSKEVNALGDSTIYSYDNFNRPIEIILPEMITWYNYNQYDELLYTNSSNGTAQYFYYDNLGRITQQVDVYNESGNTTSLERTYTYTQGNLSRVTYRSNLGNLATINYVYTNGFLRDVVHNNNILVSKLRTENEFGQPTLIETTAGVRQYAYSQSGLPIARISRNKNNETIKNDFYDFNPHTGNLMYRANRVINQGELFSYDNLNRLTVGSFGENITYDIKGNIIEKTGVGTFGYNHSSKPYAITDVALTGSAIPQLTQEVEYASFHRPIDISEGGYHSHVIYNSDFDRVKMHVTRNGVNYLRRYYLGGCYERDVDSLSNVTERLYLGGDYYTAPAVLIKDSSEESLHFIHRDYLGSITHITDRFGDVEQELSYDAWGRLRDPATLEVYEPGEEPELMIGRGYTGHEHLTWHGLINMNARLYDPVLGRFLSPDPFVQAPDLSQNFNRYTYAMNNPFRYTDETGEFFWLAFGIAAGIGAIINLATHFEELKTVGGWKSVWKGLGYAAVGGVAGGLSYWCGGLTTSALHLLTGATTTGFFSGAIVGLSSGASSGFILNTSNSLINGENLKSSLEQGLKGALTEGISGALTGGFMGGIQATSKGRNFWTGKYSDKNFFKAVAKRANTNITNDGLKGGAQKHKYAKDMVDKYQGIYGDKTDFTLEKVFVNKSEGYKIRPDVISKTKKIIYDYKFGYSYYKIGHFLCTKQMQRYRQRFPDYKIEIIHIKPKK